MSLENISHSEKNALLVLSDGRSFSGLARGVGSRTTGEVVFSTSMTGYQEALTDPSFAGQILTMTFPLQGNYGIAEKADESSRVQVEGFIVRELTDLPSHGNSVMSLDEYLIENNILAMTGVDTRSLTRHLRSSGVLMGTITTDESVDQALHRLGTTPDYSTGDHVQAVSVPSVYEFTEKNLALTGDLPDMANNPHVVVLDLGVKHNIMRLLEKRNCRVTVVPHLTPASDILSLRPDGILLSPGPGDPELLSEVTRSVTDLVGQMPMLGICLGHQLLSRALGAETEKMHLGHRGANHPVKDIETGKVEITSQNHGFVVKRDSLTNGVSEAHHSLFDGSVEGIRLDGKPVFSVQYHPEASPGPQDSHYLFDRFVGMIEENC